MNARTVRHLVQYGLLIGLLAILGVFLLYPIALTVRGGLASDPATGAGWTLEHICSCSATRSSSGGSPTR